MKTHKTLAKFAVSAVVLLMLGTAMLGFAERESPPVTRVPICVKDNGQLRMVVEEATGCGTSERQLEWVVGGQVTDITIGRGLTSTREGGTVNLALHPSIVEGCTGCQGGKIFAGFNDGPRPIPTGFPQTIAELNLPAGSYAIFAKLTVTKNTDDGGFVRDDRVICRLQAGMDFDNDEHVLADEVSTLVQHPYQDAAGLTLQVVHTFTSAGGATLSCYKPDSIPDLSFQDLKIIAIKGSGISNVFLES
jgi:hypothetical protein